MNSELKQQWITALQSGLYKQGRSYLRNLNDEYCCLGVLCDITPGINWEIITDKYAYYCKYTDDKSKVDIPVSLRKGTKISLVNQGTLIIMNDEVDKTFAEIADWIEENL